MAEKSCAGSREAGCKQLSKVRTGQGRGAGCRSARAAEAGQLLPVYSAQALPSGQHHSAHSSTRGLSDAACLVAEAQDKQSGDLDSIYCSPSGFRANVGKSLCCFVSCFPPRLYFTLLVE